MRRCSTDRLFPKLDLWVCAKFCKVSKAADPSSLPLFLQQYRVGLLTFTMHFDSEFPRYGRRQNISLVHPRNLGKNSDVLCVNWPPSFSDAPNEGRAREAKAKREPVRLLPSSFSANFSSYDLRPSSCIACPVFQYKRKWFHSVRDTSCSCLIVAAAVSCGQSGAKWVKLRYRNWKGRSCDGPSYLQACTEKFVPLPTLKKCRKFMRPSSFIVFRDTRFRRIDWINW